MKLKIIKGPIKKNINVPTSKSWANRYLILAAISKQEILIKNIPLSTDVIQLISALKKIGIKIQQKNNDIVILNSFPECEHDTESETITINTSDGGTTNRFLLSLLTRGGKNYVIKASPNFIKRPKDEIVKTLINYGINVEIGTNDVWLKVNGGCKINSDVLNISCQHSTQFISGLTLAYADTDIKFEPVSLRSSEKYYDMTKNAVTDFKKGTDTFIVPVDFSSLSYPIAFSIGFSELHFPNCFSKDELQADSYFLDFLQTKGVVFDFNQNGLTVNSSAFDYKPFELSCSGYPDLVPSLVFLACLCNGTSTLKDLKVLTYKESNRFLEIINVLKFANVKYFHDSQKFILNIHGPYEKSISGNINLPPDHRIIMLATMLLRKFGSGTINQVEHVKKSYPNFFDDFLIN